MTTEVELQTRLTAYLNAEAAILGGAQEYTIGNGSTARRLVRAELETIQRVIKEIRAELTALTAITTRARRVIYLRPFR